MTTILIRKILARRYSIRIVSLMLVALLLSVEGLYGQTSDRPVIVETVDRGSYFYIPPSALADSVHGVSHPTMIDNKTGRKTRPIEFNWNSDCTDGYYILSITPAQVYFSSAHDNPNPNFLFWVIDIDSTQFDQISRGLRKNPPKGFKNVSKYYSGSKTVFNDIQFRATFQLPNEWTDSTKEQFDQNCKAQIKSQLDRYLSILNSYISDSARKISLPVVIMQRKYFGYSASELPRMRPVKFVYPRIIEQ
ncbi:hypothetical protein [Paraflavitalea sp. CAU 1676]|uniref:hypothetical protein n=1 Tax=Paraflavitalea sp. CAU 1676 TaxID=3032598 RepID=UPI0023DB2B30|nr:hypothetical protein [Paraflavitalea sp. CAU 1676]MDF2188095.1 hypothetical protein [Paraflavitalea sp. CAU 1676]